MGSKRFAGQNPREQLQCTKSLKSKVPLQTGFFHRPCTTTSLLGTTSSTSSVSRRVENKQEATNQNPTASSDWSLPNTQWHTVLLEHVIPATSEQLDLYCIQINAKEEGQSNRLSVHLEVEAVMIQEGGKWPMIKTLSD